MQVTITLNHLLAVLLCGFLLAVILYGLHIYKNIGKELSLTAAKISRYQARLEKIEQQMASFAVTFQYMKEKATGKSTIAAEASEAHQCRNLSDCFAEIKKLLSS